MEARQPAPPAPVPAPPEEVLHPSSPPTILATLARSPELRRGMEDLDLEVCCEPAFMTPIDQEDLFGYDPSYTSVLYTICSDGTGSAWHCWAQDGTPVDDWPVVLLGSEGERAKTGRSAAEFLQISLSLVPFYRDAVGRLPGLNTLTDNGDVAAASESDFNLGTLQTQIDGWKASMEEEEDGLHAKASMLLGALSLERLSTAAALQKLIDAHLALPRFTIKAEDELDSE